MDNKNNKRGLVPHPQFVLLSQSEAIAIDNQDGVDYDSSNPDHIFKAAMLVKLVDADVSINASDIKIGGVELQDGETSLRANIEQDNTKNAIYVMSESMAQEATLSALLAKVSGDQATQTTLEELLNAINNVSGTDNAVAVSNLLQLGVVAKSVLAEVGDGNTASLAADLYGRLKIAGHNPSTDSINVTTLNQAKLNKISPIKIIDSWGSNSESAWLDVSVYSNICFDFYLTGASKSFTIIVERSYDKVSFLTEDSYTVDAGTVNFGVDYSNKSWKYVRVIIDDYADGSGTVVLSAGN